MDGKTWSYEGGGQDKDSNNDRNDGKGDHNLYEIEIRIQEITHLVRGRRMGSVLFKVVS